jgi:hypothetical protein
MVIHETAVGGHHCEKEVHAVDVELNPQPLPPRTIELGEAIEVMTAAVLRAVAARGGASPELTSASPTLPLPPPARPGIIVGIALDPRLAE